MTPVKSIISLEILVGNTEALPFDRYLAGTRLVRVWTASRYDDTEGFDMRMAEWTEDSLDILVTMSKTTGVGKDVESYKVTIARGAFLCCEWLEAWRTVALYIGGFESFLVPLPTADRLASSGVMARYSAAAACNRAMMGELMLPVLTYPEEDDEESDADTVWPVWCASTTVSLLPSGVEQVWTEHSNRSVLASWARYQQYPESTIDCLGHWRQKGGAGDARTTRQLRIKVQCDIAVSIRQAVTQGDDPVGDESALVAVRGYMVEKGYSGGKDDEQIRRLRIFEFGLKKAVTHFDEESGFALAPPQTEDPPEEAILPIVTFDLGLDLEADGRTIRSN